MLIRKIYYFSDFAFNVKSLVNSLFGVKIFNPSSSFTSFSSSSGGMGGKLSDFLSSSSSLYFLSVADQHFYWKLKCLSYNDEEYVV